MQYYVHFKNELGHDATVVVEAESESGAINSAASWGNDVSSVIGVYPVDEEAAGPELGLQQANERWRYEANERGALQSADELTIAKGLGEAMPPGLTLTEAITALEEREATGEAPHSHQARGLWGANVNNQPTAKTAEAVADAHAACKEAVNSLQDERAAELNRWHSEADTDGATRGDAFAR